MAPLGTIGCLGFQVQTSGFVSTAVFDTTKATALEQKRSKQLEDLDRVDRCGAVFGRWEDGLKKVDGCFGVAKRLGTCCRKFGMFVDFHGIFVRFSWIFMFSLMDFHEFPWIFMGFHVFHGFSWISIDLS